MLQNGPERRGYSPFVGAQTSNVLWRFPTETNYGGAVIGRDGSIYVGTLEGQFLAFNLDGTSKWTFSTYPYTVESTPAILPDGRIAFVTSHGTLTVLNPDGSKSWLFRTGVGCFCGETSPVIGRDGAIYFVSAELVYALNSDGTTRWIYDVGGSIGGAPAVREDGVVYIPGQRLTALDPDGAFLWHSVYFPGGGTPTIGPDGTIYVNAFEPSALYALRPNGTRKWSYKLEGGANPDVPSSPALGPDGTIYVGESLDAGIAQADGVVLALNHDGTLKWQVQHGSWPTAISVGGDGTIYFGSGSAEQETASVFALNPDGTLKWQYDDPESGYVRTPPAIGKGQRIYAGSLNAFFAIGP